MADPTEEEGWSRLPPEQLRQLAVDTLERAVARHPVDTLPEAHAVLSGLRHGHDDLSAQCAAAAARAQILERIADQAYEAGPGTPHDAPGPWAWLALTHLTSAAARIAEAPQEAMRLVDQANFAETHPTRDLQRAERAWRIDRLETLLESR